MGASCFWFPTTQTLSSTERVSISLLNDPTLGPVSQILQVAGLSWLSFSPPSVRIAWQTPKQDLLSHSVVSSSFVILGTAGCQAPLPMGFPKQECWSGFPFPSPGHLPNPGIKSASPALAGGFFTTEPPGKPQSGTACSPVRSPLCNQTFQCLCTSISLRLKWDNTNYFMRL